MTLTTLKSIESALNQIDTKKQNLKKAFEHLQSHSTLIPSLTVTWPQLDTYFTTLQSQLIHDFATLQQHQKTLIPEKPQFKKPDPVLLPATVPARPELRSLCVNMDGLGLRRYLIDRPKERIAIRVELVDAYKHAPDAASLVLDAIEGFMDRDLGKSSKLRTVCVVLLEELVRAGVEVGDEVRERARGVAEEWEGKMSVGEGEGDGGEGEEEGKEEDGGLEKLGYLHLLANYGLFGEGSGRDEGKLVEYVVAVARCRQAVELCRVLGLESSVPDVIKRIIVKGKQLVALKFIFEFELTDEFPPVPLLKAYLSDSKKIAQKVRSSSNSRQAQNEADSREISALKAVIKCIKDHNLESQYPKAELVARIDKLEKERTARKKPAVAPTVPKPQQQLKPPPKQNGKKRNRTAAGPGPGPSKIKRKIPAKSNGPHSLSSSAYRAGFHTDHPAPSPAGPYGAAGAQYMGSAADLYGHSTHLGFSSDQNPVVSNPYSFSETYAQPSHYDGTVGYGGYNVPPQYHPGYYPQ